MSFLPYAPDPPATWITAVSGSTAVHGAMLTALFMSSVALLPEPSTSALRTPEFEITLEIVDADIIDLGDTAISPDTGALSPIAGDSSLPDQVQDLGLAPVEDTALLTPEDDVIAPVADVLTPVEEDFATLAPEPEVVPDLPEVVEDAPVVEPEVASEPEPLISEPAPVAPTATQDPDGLAIDDLSPIEDSVISPLAESVAPVPPPIPVPTAPVTQSPVAQAPATQDPVAQAPVQEVVPAPPVALAPDVTLAPNIEAQTEEEAVAVLPDPELPTPDAIEPDTPEESIAPTALPPSDDSAPAPEVGEEDVAPVVVVEEATPPATGEEVALPAPFDTGSTPDTVDVDVQPGPVNQATLTDELAALVPEAPDRPGTPDTEADPAAPQIIANPSPSAQLIGTLLQRIRNIPAPQCTLALPRRVGPEDVAVSFVGSNADQLDTLASRVLDGLATAPAQTREVLDARQCAVLDAVRLSATYPASRIGLSVEDTTLISGDNLKARVIGAGGLYLSLLLIDDNGVVQDLARFASLEDSVAVIDAPVARAGDARTTRQVLLVLGSPEAPIDFSQNIGRTAQEALSTVPSETLEQALFGLITFDVQ